MPTVHIANHTARTIEFYRTPGSGRLNVPLKVEAGHVLALDSDVWDDLKNMDSVKGLLEISALAEVKAAHESVPIGVEKTADPEIPEHLRESDQFGTQLGTKAGIVKAEPKTVEISTDFVEGDHSRDEGGRFVKAEE